MGITQKRAAPRLQGRPGQPTFYAYMDGPRRTLPGDTGDVADLCGGTPALARNAGCVWADGVTGKCLSFNGTTGLATASGFSLAAGSAVTVTLSVNAPSGTQAASAFSLGNQDSPNRCQAHIPYSDGTLYWDFGDSAGGGRVSTPFGSYIGKRTHVALVSTGAAAKFQGAYLNAALVASQNTSHGTAALSGVWVGKFLTFFYLGTVSDFRVFPRALSAAEVAREYADPDYWTRPRKRVGASLAGAGPRALYHFRRRRTA